MSEPAPTVGHDDRPRILHVISGLGVGGAEASLEKVVVGLANRWQAMVTSLVGGPVAARLAPIEVVLPPGTKGPTRVLFELSRIAKTLRSFDPHIVQGWMYHGDLAAWAVARYLGGDLRLVWNVRSSPDRLRETSWHQRLALRVNARLSRQPAAIVFNAHASVARHRELGYRPRRFEVIPNGFETDRYRPNPEARARLRRELQIDEQTSAVGFIARYHQVKGFPLFLSAARSLAQRQERVVFVLVGRGVDSTNQELVGLLDSLGLGSCVRLLGLRDDVPDLLAALDLLCVASHEEALPNVIGEAMACGLPCVGSNVGDMARLLGDTGVLVAPRNAESLAGGLERLVSLGEEGRRRLGKAARERIVSRFALSTMLDAYDRLYRDLLASARSPGATKGAAPGQDPVAEIG